MKNKNLFLSVLLFSFLTLPVSAQSEIHVSSIEGNDDTGTGSIDSPFQTISKAVDIANPGDSIFVMKGTYKEIVYINKDDLTIKAIESGVVVDGTEEVQLQNNGKIKYAKLDPEQTPVTGQVEQVFNANKNKMYWEARWPNASPEKVWVDRRSTNTGWAPVSKGTKATSTTRAKVVYQGHYNFSNIPTSEPLIIIYNGFSQFRTYGRNANFQNHGGGFSLSFDLNSSNGSIGEIDPTSQKSDPDWWEDDYFYIKGNKRLLDNAGEWYYDKSNKKLELISLDGSNTVHVKVRPFSFIIHGAENTKIEGMKFFATAIKSEDRASDSKQTTGLIINDNHFLYPSWDRMLRDNDKSSPQFRPNSPATDGIHLTADKVVFTNNLVEKGGTYGVYVNGINGLIKNNVVRDIDWFGNLEHAGIIMENTRDKSKYMSGKIHSNTVYNFGNNGIRFFGRGIDVGYNNVSYGGLLSLDTSLIYTARSSTIQSRIHHNFVHNGTGIGIRLDGYSVTGTTVDHNIVWKVRRGIKISGYNNVVNNNTIDTDNRFYALLIEWGPELKGSNPLRKAGQNRNTFIYNNLAYRVHYRNRSERNGTESGELYNKGSVNNPLKRLQQCKASN